MLLHKGHLSSTSRCLDRRKRTWWFENDRALKFRSFVFGGKTILKQQTFDRPDTVFK